MFAFKSDQTAAREKLRINRQLETLVYECALVNNISALDLDMAGELMREMSRQYAATAKWEGDLAGLARQPPGVQYEGLVSFNSLQLLVSASRLLARLCAHQLLVELGLLDISHAAYSTLHGPIRSRLREDVYVRGKKKEGVFLQCV